MSSKNKKKIILLDLTLLLKKCINFTCSFGLDNKFIKLIKSLTQVNWLIGSAYQNKFIQHIEYENLRVKSNKCKFVGYPTKLLDNLYHLVEQTFLSSNMLSL
jgi:hypothetical protein